MNLIDLYNLKLTEYHETGLREKPWKLLAMLLLNEKDHFEILNLDNDEFYQKYQTEINEKIAQVEKDFNFTYEYFVTYIEKNVKLNNYEYQKMKNNSYLRVFL